MESIWIEINCIDSVSLWNSISMYGVNVTDMGTITYVYGDVKKEFVPYIVEECKKYGEIRG